MSADIEAVLLTGGASRRMGADKASLSVDGTAMADRIARVAVTECCRVTVLGREPLPGLPFLEDSEEHAGPLSALARFEPACPLVFVAACDMPLFKPGIIEGLARSLAAEDDAVVPSIGGKAQPLCGVYRAECWSALRANVGAGTRRVAAWLQMVKVRYLEDGQLRELGLDPDSMTAVNTPEELEVLLGRRQGSVGG